MRQIIQNKQKKMGENLKNKMERIKENIKFELAFEDYIKLSRAAY